MRKLLSIKKMGHAGTLDPLATGCLLVATGKSTKLLSLLEGSEKTYCFSVDISGTTASLDLGTHIESFEGITYRDRTPDELREYLSSQTQQVPPKYSAIHIDGKRAYDLARENIHFDIALRPIQIKNVEILYFSPPIFTISLRISSGGYIRSLAPVIGDLFGTPGGYITELRRTEIHTGYTDLGIQRSSLLDNLTQESSLSRALLFPYIITVYIDESIVRQLQEGRIINRINSIQGIVGQLYFFDYEDSWSSLVQYLEDGFHIIRNDI